MNYPGKVKEKYNKVISYANRGMNLESIINEANQNYLDNDLAVIYKKPTPIGIIKVDYSNKKITDAYFKEPSTLDYNGLYKGKYIEFDAKECNNKTSFPIKNIHEHQLVHMHNIIKHHGICFLIISMNEKYFLTDGRFILNFIKENERKSIPYDEIAQNSYEIKYNYLKGLDYLESLDKLMEEYNEK